jgi:TonB-linked SusC/RagA family outer membrane protein
VIWLVTVAVAPRLGAQERILSAADATVTSDTTAAAALLTRPVSVHLDHVALRHAVDAVAASANVHVQYRVDLLDASQKRVTLQASNLPLRAAFEKVLSGTGMQVVPLAGGVLNIEADRPLASAFEGTIGGVVRDAKTNQPIAGAIVSVAVHGRTYSVASARDGRFTLPAMERGTYTLTVRRLGYLLQEKKIVVSDGETSGVTFSLSAVPLSLQEVVTTGAGDIQALEVGNSVGRINADSLVRTTPIRNLSDLLKGRTTGVDVLETSGTVGTGSRIRIRGLSSMLTSEDPVVIVDGVRIDASYTRTSFNQTGGPLGIVVPGQNGASQAWVPSSSRLDDIDPESIESIDVLKGPAASALYGSDAANGVIVIKTKHGHPGRTRWTVSAEGSQSNLDAHFADNYYGWGKLNGLVPLSVSCTRQMVATQQCTLDSVTHFNPLNDSFTSPLRTAYAQRYNGQVSGGSDQLQYFVGTTYDDENGPVRFPPSLLAATKQALNGAPLPGWALDPNILNSLAVNGNLTAQLGSAGDVGLSANARRQYHRDVPSGYYGFVNQAISAKGYLDTLTGGWGAASPVQTFLTRNDDQVSHGYGALTGDWRPLPRLSAHGVLGADYSTTDAQSFLPTQYAIASSFPGNSSQRNRNAQTSFVKTADFNATYEWPLGSAVSLRSTAGGQYSGNSSTTLNVTASGLPYGGTTVNGATTVKSYEYNGEQITAGWYLQEMISLHQRLFVTGAVRADASSAFGPDAKAVAYPKWNASWLISQEPFFPSIPALSSLRLRVGYGHAGTQPPFDARFRTYAYQTGFLNGASVNAVGIATPGNPDLLPERSVESEGGFDLSFGDDRITLSATLENKRTSNALVTRQLPGSFGGLTQMENIGKISNRNTEFSATLRPIVDRTLTWNTTFLLTRTWNTLVTLGPSAPSPDAVEPWAFTRYVPGYPVDGLWVRAIAGYYDANGDGIIEPSELKVTDSSVFVGHTSPSALLSWQNNVAFWNGWVTVGANFVYEGGATQYNSLAVNQCQNGVCQGAVDPNATVTQQVLAAAGQQITDWPFIERVSTFRFDELSLTARAPQAVAHWVHAPNTTISLMGRNLKLWTHYRGADPDVNSSHSGGDDVVDEGGIPQPRTWTLRINLGF